MSLEHSSSGWFEASACTAAPGGRPPSLVQHGPSVAMSSQPPRAFVAHSRQRSAPTGTGPLRLGLMLKPVIQHMVQEDVGESRRIGIGGHLTMPPLPHHRAYGSVPRRFDRIRPQQGCRVWGGRAGRNGGCVGPAGPPHVRPCASTPSASQRRWRLGPLRVPGGGAP